jgi:type I restriction enzyme M protein
MAIKKSKLHSSLWKSCDELRGGMDASQYKDYVLVMLFIKYVSDKYSGKKDAIIEVPRGASFDDLVKLKGKSDIGDQINKLIGKLAKPNGLTGIIDTANFNDPDKLGSGKAMVDRLSKLVAIFENPGLDFSRNRSADDDILGDAYEYLMRNFATESGKSKGQFYTPAEVSRVLAKIIGINKAKSKSQTLYDPTCGSGSLLLKAADESPYGVTIYGQDKDVATRALAVMNMWLHGKPSAEIKQEDTLSNPQFKDKNTGDLKTFDFVVANPPFSYKSWSSGIDPQNDIYERFTNYGIPPVKNGDYAFLLHIIKSLKSKGKGACILPHGVLFRGNVEADIRRNIIRRGYIKGIIGLPPNLFYGTSISACIVVIDKENAETRKGIFMINASKGFMKDGNKNRLREQDIHKIVDVFNNQIKEDKYSRMVSISEISDPKNDYNLNIPRYINNQEEEDLQDIDAHLRGDIPEYDIDDLQKYWYMYPSLRNVLFGKGSREKYLKLEIKKDVIKSTILGHPEFVAYSKELQNVFDRWKKKTTNFLKKLDKGTVPKDVIQRISEDMLKVYEDNHLIEKYDMYQHMLNYWTETMQDDLYELAADGWKAGNEVARQIKEGKKSGKASRKEVEGIEGLEGRLIPPTLLIEMFFRKERSSIEELEEDKEAISLKMKEMEEEHSGEEGILEGVKSDKGKVIKGIVHDRVLEIKETIIKSSNYPATKKNLVKAIKKSNFSKIKWKKGVIDNQDLFAELDVFHDYLGLMDEESHLSKEINETLRDMEGKVTKKYSVLSIDDIKNIVVDNKWMASIEKLVQTEIDRISQRLSGRIKELAERYENTLPELNTEINKLEKSVNTHLKEMGFTWK